MFICESLIVIGTNSCNYKAVARVDDFSVYLDLFEIRLKTHRKPAQETVPLCIQDLKGIPVVDGFLN